MLRIYNTATRRQEAFKPLVAGKACMYVCGMTVYDHCHIGHARMLVVFDVIARCLRMLGYEVIYVRNITDIDDKILKRAAEANEHYSTLSGRFIDALNENCKNLRLSEASSEPRATQYIDQIVHMIQKLLDDGYAYIATNNDVYYEIERFSDYGKLSGQNPEQLMAGARVAQEKHKKHPGDFALWKAADADAVGWDAPWSYGRPGWHIECSAMCKACLGDTIDIHGGGSDLLFPHHENEAAQSEAANGQPLARYWVHAGAVRVAGGDDMSKSRGNFVRLCDVLDDYHPEVLRYYLLCAHYRSAIEYDADALVTAGVALERLYRALPEGASPPVDLDRDEKFTRQFIACLEDDFNVPEALAVLFNLARTINASSDEAERMKLGLVLKALGQPLGLLEDDADQFLRYQARNHKASLDDVQIEDLISQRNEARSQGDYALGDKIRKQLEQAGVFLEDHGKSTTWHRKMRSQT
jgi:cysteinyl-tRNA synthetase